MQDCHAHNTFRVYPVQGYTHQVSSPPEFRPTTSRAPGPLPLHVATHPSLQVDSWALGATLYLMVEAAYPFDLKDEGGRNVAAMLRAEVQGKLRPMQTKYRGTLLEQLIRGMLEPDPARRQVLAGQQARS